MEEKDTFLYSLFMPCIECWLFALQLSHDIVISISIFHVSETCDSENSHRLLSQVVQFHICDPIQLRKEKYVISWNQSRVPRAQCLEISPSKILRLQLLLSETFIFIYLDYERILAQPRRLRFKTCGKIIFVVALRSFPAHIVTYWMDHILIILLSLNETEKKTVEPHNNNQTGSEYSSVLYHNDLYAFSTTFSIFIFILLGSLFLSFLSFALRLFSSHQSPPRMWE